MKDVERELARKLRTEGRSIKDIAENIGASKGSVSKWVSDIELSEFQLKELEEKQKRWGSQNKGAQANKQQAISRRFVFRENGYKTAKEDERFKIICALYWGEGSKSKNVFSIANCDPKMLRLIGLWLVEKKWELSFRVAYYGENGINENEIKKWWKQQLPFLTEDCFRKFTVCKINRASQKKKIGSRPYGTGSLTVTSTELVQMIYGGIDFLSK